MVGLRVRDRKLLELGMELPGLPQRAAALAELPALGVLTLAGMLPDDWSCSYHESIAPNLDSRDTFVEEIVSSQPALAAISALTASALEAYALSDKLRAQGIRTVLGGLHATACPDEAAKHFDAVVIGEGEPIWHQLLADANLGKLKPRYQPHRSFELAKSPLPRFDLLGPRTRPRMTLQTQRGCPLACEFCAASRLLGSFREKPMANIRAELASMKALVESSPHPRRLWLELADDNTFVGNRDWRPLLKTLGESEARYFTESDWRIGEDEALVKALAESGCVQVLIGIESIHFRYPGMGRKASELARMIEATERLQAAGVVVNGCLIVGADGETNASIDRLIEFVLGSPFAELQVTLQTPFPGTALRQKLDRQNRILADRDWSHYTLFDVTYQPDCISPAELELGFRRVLTSVFTKDENHRRQQLRRTIWRRGGQFSNSRG